MSASTLPASRADLPSGGRNYVRHHWMFTVPAALVVAAVIVFPWIFTLYMSVHDWKVSGTVPCVGLANYAKMLMDDRFL
jgi:multiple sugar transport system permease protein